MVKRIAYDILNHNEDEIKKNVERTRRKAENAKTSVLFANRLNKELTKNEINQEEFADKINISTGALSNYRNGKNIPTVDIVVKMANEFKCSTDYLLGLTDLKSTNSDFKTIHEITGLTDKSIEYLKNMNDDKYIIDTLNFLFENENKYQFLSTLKKFLWSKVWCYNRYKELILDNGNISLVGCSCQEEYEKEKEKKALEQLNHKNTLNNTLNKICEDLEKDIK